MRRSALCHDAKCPTVHSHCVVEWKVYVDDSKSNVRIRRDLMEAMGQDLLFSESLMKWDKATIPMRDNSWLQDITPNPFRNDVLSMHDPITTEVERIQGILDLKHAPSHLDKIVQECTHLLLIEEDQKALQEVLAKNKDVFDGLS